MGRSREAAYLYEYKFISEQGAKMKHEIPVTYLCWGCGSSSTRYELEDLPLPAREEWNLCPDCILHDDASQRKYSGQLGNSKPNTKKEH